MKPKIKYLLHFKARSFAWQSRDKIIERLAGWNILDVQEKKVQKQFCIFKTYEYVFKSDKKAHIENFVKVLSETHGWPFSVCYLTCRDMSNADVNKFAKTLIVKTTKQEVK